MKNAMSHALFRPITGKEDEILDFIMQAPEVRAHPSVSYAVRLVCEEIIVNIIHYAYPGREDGYIGIDIADDGNALRIMISDGGKPFNPLDSERPDTAKALEDREIGGLGIFLVRQMTDGVSYARADGENRLLLVKNTQAKDG